MESKEPRHEATNDKRKFETIEETKKEMKKRAYERKQETKNTSKQESGCATAQQAQTGVGGNEILS